MTPTIYETDQGPFELTADRGTMRMILMCALADANLWTRATGASTETKNHWARRAKIIRELLEQLPASVNPRDPYEDLPDEPTPEEAAAKWRERAAAEDAREAARAARQKPAAVEPRYFYHPESDCLMTTTDGSHPGSDGLVEEIDRAEYERIADLQAKAADDDIHMIDGHGPLTSAQVAELERQFSSPTDDDIEDLLAL